MANGKPGRPSIYTDEIALEICQRLEQGEALYKICEAEHLPDYHTVCNWQYEDREGFLGKVARAREQAAYYIHEEAQDIADNVQFEGDNKVLANAALGKAKLRAEIRLKRAGALNSKLADRYRQEHSGRNGTPINIKIVKYNED